MSLVAESVDTWFGYPGGVNLKIFDVLPLRGSHVLNGSN